MRDRPPPRIRSARWLLFTLVLAVSQLALECVVESRIVILSPDANRDAGDCIDEISFELVGNFDLATLDVTLNFQPLAVSNGGAGS